MSTEYQNQYPGRYPEDSQAVLALVLGIIGLVACGVAGPFAWSIGNKELRAIDAGRRSPENRGMANAGKILGIISTVLLVLAVVGGVLFVLFAIVLSSTGSLQ